MIASGEPVVAGRDDAGEPALVGPALVGLESEGLGRVELRLADESGSDFPGTEAPEPFALAFRDGEAGEGAGRKFFRARSAPWTRALAMASASRVSPG